MLDILPQQIFLEESHQHQHGDDDKINNGNGNLYLCQPHTLTVIELVEVAPPPPRRITSVINSSSSAYHSSSSSSSSFDDEVSMDEEEDGDDQDMDEDDEDEEEEEICSSYCSSDYSPEELDMSKQHAAPLPAAAAYGYDSDSFARRMKRILSWRQFSSESLSSEPSLKRKLEEIDESLVDDNDDNVSHSSKRSRSHASSVSSHSNISSEELNMHPCPACDAFFPTLQSLREHGQRDAPHTSEACCVAVEYAFEQ